jgi:PAS domain-containing protein
MIHFQDHALLLNQTYQHWFGDYLVNEQDPGNVLAALNEDERVIFSLGLEPEPVFNYGNVKALGLFGYELAEFIQLPGRATMAPDQATIDQMLQDEIGKQGYVADYTGVRLDKRGRSWQIEAGKIWQLVDNLGRLHGFAGCFTDWSVHKG